MLDLNNAGADWLAAEVDEIVESVNTRTPSVYNEEVRYLPASVTSRSGYIRYKVNPFMREIVDCFDVDSPVREISLQKGVQITYSTVLESGVLYYADEIGTLPMMYVTADKELAAARIENNFIPMFNHSDRSDIIKSSDIGNSRKTGKTKSHLQFAKGATLIPFGAKNADKMRSFSIAVMLKDEIDAWPESVGKDGDPDELTSARCSGFWNRRKIFRGSTPTVDGVSKIQKAYLRGDQRRYHVPCKHCGHMQPLRWYTVDKETGVIGGIMWDMNGRTLDLESVRYCCVKCGGAHYEHDKARMFAESSGAKWIPSAEPAEPNVRSYHLSALYSPIGMQPWYQCVALYLEAWDVEKKTVKDVGKLQVFYNNILAKTFKVKGSKIRFEAVSAHRRQSYVFGTINNTYVKKHTGDKILFIILMVDVHKRELPTAVFGVGMHGVMFLLDYKRIQATGEGDACDTSLQDNGAWAELKRMRDETEYVADDGAKYKICMTFVDAGYNNDTVNNFCAQFESGVYPILGRDRTSNNQQIREFSPFETKIGTTGYRILVDHYKDRLAPVLRREWTEEQGLQNAHHFNAPLDVTDEQLKEFTTENRVKKVNERGQASYVWHRPQGAANELWDLLVYANCAVDVLCYSIHVDMFGMSVDQIDWKIFWEYASSDDGGNILGRT